MKNEEESAVTGDPYLQSESDNIPTAELMRRRRKAAYEAGKTQRKTQKIADKLAKDESKAATRNARDQAIWQALKHGNEI